MNTPLLLPKHVTQWVTVGRVGRVFGVHGWIKIHSLTQPFTNIINYKPWYLWRNQEWQAINVTEIKKHGQSLLAHFPGCTTPEEAKQYTNAVIGVPREQLPDLPSQEYYWADLIGLKVYNHKQEYLGIIERLFETGANDVIVVKNQGHEILIPYVMDHIVLSIDLTQKVMLVEWEKDSD